MQFNSNAEELDLISDITFWTKVGVTEYPLLDRTRNINLGLDKVIDLIMKADERWKFEDSNQSDLSIATTDFVASQEDYGFLASDFLKIIRVEAKDGAGNYRRLLPFDQSDIKHKGLSELLKTAGNPTHYRIEGNSIHLYPKPSGSTSEGLQLLVQRDVVYFASTDTTAKPGFAQPYHRLLSLYASRDYLAVEEQWDRLKMVDAMIKRMEAGLVDFYSNRNVDDKPIRLKLRRENYGANELGQGDSSDKPAVNWGS